jgi:hypothetical protein
MGMDDAIIGRDELLCGASERCEAECIVSAASVYCDEAVLFEFGSVGSDAALVETHIDIASEVPFLTLAVVWEVRQEAEPPAPRAILLKRLPRVHRVDSLLSCGCRLPGRTASVRKVVAAVKMVVAPLWMPTIKIRVQAWRDDEVNMTDVTDCAEDSQRALPRLPMVYAAPSLCVEFDSHSRRLTGELEQPKRPVPEDIDAIIVVGTRPSTELSERGDDDLISILLVTLAVVFTPLETVDPPERVPERIMDGAVSVDTAIGSNPTVAQMACYPGLVASIIREVRSIQNEPGDRATKGWQELFEEGWRQIPCLRAHFFESRPVVFPP